MLRKGYTRWNNAPPQKVPGLISLIIRGILVSFAFSLVCALLLSVFSLISENEFIDQHLQYIMVGISIISIFCGSVFATQKAESKGLFIGMAVGIAYVCISVLIGKGLQDESLSLLVFINKLLAGIAAGSLGGLVGVNL
ncbi:putative membrane protein [Propionispora sp. 2/2-37]|uniref:TIGR04086 family membrane protein n=1 Tax=Propionispora sp. 2/2-37 TaxID=1677858 RepID=UPI0006BB852C|nr:TIGR04086 family membrane protein [Propionispora sp. 2/2-37]CUH94246.1 putative membrane protein [Propionispora sp. 2/2-37]